MELKLKHMDCELIIRKKGAFAQSAAAAPVVMVQHPHQPMLPPHPPMSQTAPAAPPPSASAPTPPSPIKGSKSTLSPLKCPMAGTFYRSPAPGEPPFVKVSVCLKSSPTMYVFINACFFLFHGLHIQVIERMVLCKPASGMNSPHIVLNVSLSILTSVV